MQSVSRRGLWLVALILALILAPYYVDETSQKCVKDYRQDTILKINGQDIAAEIAADPTTLQKGLSGRGCIGSKQAMLFSFKEPGSYPFWMKYMKFPIDIVWLDAEHKVVTIKANVQPNTFPQSFVSDKPAQYVLEFQADHAAELGLKIGTYIPF